MKISAEQLRLIIVEELRSVLSEGFEPYPWKMDTFTSVDYSNAIYKFTAQVDKDSPEFEYEVKIVGKASTTYWEVNFFADKVVDGKRDPDRNPVAATGQMDRRVFPTIAAIIKDFALEHRPTIKIKVFRNREGFYAKAIHEPGSTDKVKSKPSARQRVYRWLLRQQGIIAEPVDNTLLYFEIPVSFESREQILKQLKELAKSLTSTDPKSLEDAIANANEMGYNVWQEPDYDYDDKNAKYRRVFIFHKELYDIAKELPNVESFEDKSRSVVIKMES